MSPNMLQYRYVKWIIHVQTGLHGPDAPFQRTVVNTVFFETPPPTCIGTCTESCVGKSLSMLLCSMPIKLFTCPKNVEFQNPMASGTLFEMKRVRKEHMTVLTLFTHHFQKSTVKPLLGNHALKAPAGRQVCSFIYIRPVRGAGRTDCMGQPRQVAERSFWLAEETGAGCFEGSV